MKNTLNDLNNHLFEEMERLSDEDLKGDELNQEIERSKAVASVGDKIIQNANLILKANVAYGSTDSIDAKDRPALLLGNGKYEVHKRSKTMDKR